MSQKFFQIIRPVHVHLKMDKVDFKKRPPWKKKILHFFSIDSSSRHEKRCQMLQTLFLLFQCSKNPLWTAATLTTQQVINLSATVRILHCVNYLFISLTSVLEFHFRVYKISEIWRKFWCCLKWRSDELTIIGPIFK